jgi:hypothetical protein
MNNVFRRLEKKPALTGSWLFLLLVVLFIPQVFSAYELLQESVMLDLHSRTIGSRLLDNGRSPYFYTWQPGDGVRLYDPNLFLPNGLSGVTATPVFIWLTKYLARLNYCDVRFYWWLLEELLLLATVWLTAIIASNLWRQMVVIALAMVFFCYSRNWWLHIYSGQYYIVFTFLFAWSTHLLLTRKNKEVSLLLLPIFSLIRPFFILSALPLLLKFTKRKVVAVVIGGLIALVIVIVSGSLKMWPDYNKAMKLYAQENTVGFKAAAGINDPRVPGLPVEGCVKMVSERRFWEPGCLFSLQHYLKIFGISIENTTVYIIILLAAIAIILLLLVKRKTQFDQHALILASFLIYILSELVTPASRNPYNLVQYLAVLGILINRSSVAGIVLISLGLALNHDFPFRFAYQREIGELVLLGAICFAIKFPAKAKTVDATV